MAEELETAAAIDPAQPRPIDLVPEALPGVVQHVFDNQPTPTDPFEGHEPLEGLEYLGRHIRDRDGQPSGSPANFEQMRGQAYPVGHPLRNVQPTAPADVRQALAAEFPPEPVVESLPSYGLELNAPPPLEEPAG